ncbi:MAG TPA: pyridoxal-phosphate dependent enzyme [Gemmatimonadaceae bacterium]|jgi:threonine dehydratase
MTTPTLAASTLDEIVAARARIEGTALRTPLVRLYVDAPTDIWLKLECLQPIGSFKLRGATNAMRRLSEDAPERLSAGVYTASAGNMAQGVAWGARALGIACTVVVPDTAPSTKLAAIERLGARIDKRPFDAWWRVIAEHGDPHLPGTFIHPFADNDVMAGNATIALEIQEDLPNAGAILVPYGGGGLACGIAAGVRAAWPSRAPRVYACEVDSASPLDVALRTGQPATASYVPSFVDGIGSKRVADEMWPLVRSLLEGAIVVPVRAVADAVRLVVERARVVAEGAGAAAVAAALTGQVKTGPIVCIVSGGNIDLGKLSAILRGELP